MQHSPIRSRPRQTLASKLETLGYYRELVTMLIRGTLYQLIRLRFRGWVLLGKGGRMLGLSRITFRGVAKIGDFATLDARFSQSVVLGRRFSLGAFSIMRASGSPSFMSAGIAVGDSVTFGPYCNIGGGFGLTIGDQCIFGPYVSIHPESHEHSDPVLPIREQGIEGQGILIHTNCWFGAKATVLDGSVIEPGSVFAAGAMIARRHYPANSVYGGIPAKRLKSRVDESRAGSQ